MKKSRYENPGAEPIKPSKLAPYPQTIERRSTYLKIIGNKRVSLSSILDKVPKGIPFNEVIIEISTKWLRNNSRWDEAEEVGTIEICMIKTDPNPAHEKFIKDYPGQLEKYKIEKDKWDIAYKNWYNDKLTQKELIKQKR